MTQKFTARLQRVQGTGTWTYLTVPFRVEEVFGTRSRVAVKGTVEGEQFRGSLMPHGDGKHFLVVNKEIRKAIGKEAGEKVRVRLERDTAPRLVEVPRDFQRALNKHKPARTAFDRLSYSHRKEYVVWIEGAKKAETKNRRIAKAIEKLLAEAK